MFRIFLYTYFLPAKDIVDAIEECEHMTALRLEGNTVGVEAAEAIAKAIGKHSEFEVYNCCLWLSN